MVGGLNFAQLPDESREAFWLLFESSLDTWLASSARRIPGSGEPRSGLMLVPYVAQIIAVPGTVPFAERDMAGELKSPIGLNVDWETGVVLKVDPLNEKAESGLPTPQLYNVEL